MFAFNHTRLRLPSLPTIKQSNSQRKCKQAFKGTSVIKKQKTLFN